jgi:starch phosphorylase
MWTDIWGGIDESNVPITSVTNGVHLPTWIHSRTVGMLNQYLAPGWQERHHEPETWKPVIGIPDEVYWSTHLAAKNDLFNSLKKRSRNRWVSGHYDPAQVVTAGPYLQPDVLTIGFARRFATYKRATLIFHDPDRLARLLNDQDRPVQIIFAGKAHPADEGGKRLIQEIFWRARDPRFGGRIAFAEDYDMNLAIRLVSGVDVWLNNPRAPLEASGTSGMKASANGAPNLSILDGWWREAWESDNSNGWGIEPSKLDGWAQDADEANLIYETLEQLVLPMYYDVDAYGLPRTWIRLSKEAMRTVAPAFSARRMVIDYITRLYVPAAGVLAPV